MSQQYPQYPPQGYQPPKKKHTVRNVFLALGAAFVLFVGGCTAIVASLGDGTDATKQTTVDTGPSPDPITTPTNTPPAAAETTPTAEPSSDIAKVGSTQWFTYEDKLQVQVTKLTRFKISSYAAGGKAGDVGVIVTVTIKNGSGEVFDAALADVKLAAGPNGDEADKVYDSENNVGGGFEGSIPAGRSKTARYGFAVSKAHLSKLVAEVTPSWDHDPSFFEGAVK